MALTWPITLPQYVLVSDWKETPESTLITTSMSTGPKKVRAKYSEPNINVTIGMWLNSAQYNELMTFHKTTSQGGSLSFTFTHPILNEAMDWRMLQPPSLVALGGITYKVIMTWTKVII